MRLIKTIKFILFSYLLHLQIINSSVAQNSIGLYSDYYQNNSNDLRIINETINIGGLYQMKNICDNCDELSFVIKNQLSFMSLDNNLKALYNTIIFNPSLRFGHKYGYFIEGGVFGSYLIKEDVNNSFIRLKKTLFGLNFHNGFHYLLKDKIEFNLGINIYFNGFRFDERVPCQIGNCGDNTVKNNIYTISLAIIYKLHNK